MEKAGRKKAEKAVFFCSGKKKKAKKLQFFRFACYQKMAYLSQKIHFIQEVGKFER